MGDITMNDRVMELHRNPRHKGSLPSDVRTDATAILQADGSNPLCGDSLHMEVAIAGPEHQIAAIAWDGYACSLCCASAEALARELIGSNIAECTTLTADTLSAFLDGTKPSRSRQACMELPLTALKEALSNYEH